MANERISPRTKPEPMAHKSSLNCDKALVRSFAELSLRIATPWLPVGVITEVIEPARVLWSSVTFSGNPVEVGNILFDAV